MIVLNDFDFCKINMIIAGVKVSGTVFIPWDVIKKIRKINISQSYVRFEEKNKVYYLPLYSKCKMDNFTNLSL